LRCRHSQAVRPALVGGFVDNPLFINGRALFLSFSLSPAESKKKEGA
jgi:hypothetical protein